jgi:hypothetical protein
MKLTALCLAGFFTILISACPGGQGNRSSGQSSQSSQSKPKGGSQSALSETWNPWSNSMKGFAPVSKDSDVQTVLSVLTDVTTQKKINNDQDGAGSDFAVVTANDFVGKPLNFIADVSALYTVFAYLVLIGKIEGFYYNGISYTVYLTKDGQTKSPSPATTTVLTKDVLEGIDNFMVAYEIEVAKTDQQQYKDIVYNINKESYKRARDNTDMQIKIDTESPLSREIRDRLNDLITKGKLNSWAYNAQAVAQRYDIYCKLTATDKDAPGYENATERYDEAAVTRIKEMLRDHFIDISKFDDKYQKDSRITKFVNFFNDAIYIKARDGSKQAIQYIKNQGPVVSTTEKEFMIELKKLNLIHNAEVATNNKVITIQVLDTDNM